MKLLSAVKLFYKIKNKYSIYKIWVLRFLRVVLTENKQIAKISNNYTYRTKF